VAITDDGRPKIVLLFAHWCPHCQDEVSDYQDYFDANGFPGNVDFYSISTGTDATRANYPPSEWLADEGWTVPLIVDDADDSASRALGLTAFPFTVIVDADGRIVARAAGSIPIDSLIELAAQLG
jgi:thiol-disulfide isomerase/thioredoxin